MVDLRQASRGHRSKDLDYFLKNQSNLVLLFLKNKSIDFLQVFYLEFIWVFDRVMSSQSFFYFFLKPELVEVSSQVTKPIRVIIILLI